MAVTYKILKVELPSLKVPAPGVATIEVDFGDGTPVYTKRMMAPVTDKAALVAAIEGWLADYLPHREVPVVPKDVAALVGKKQKVG